MFVSCLAANLIPICFFSQMIGDSQQLLLQLAQSAGADYPPERHDERPGQ